MHLARPLATVALALATGLSTLTGAAAVAAPAAGAGADRSTVDRSTVDRSTVDRSTAARMAVAHRTLVAAEDALAGSGGDATLALRDLRLARGDLSTSGRAAAERLLARPAAHRTRCGVVCVHWSTRGKHKATARWARKVLRTVDGVHRTYVAAGYRAPKPDGRAGGDRRTDVYVRNLDPGLYGYCTSDQQTRRYDVWAYCVVDNDYRGFPANTPAQNLRVTAAHEYFHAVQFGYDSSEDAWLTEGTATWVEDELFDGVDDNRQFLASSPMSHPHRPLDEAGGTFPYGAWLFFRYLSERLPARTGTLADVVRRIWEQADARRGAPDRTSTGALAHVLARSGTDLPTLFARFADANRRPAETYAEGGAREYAPAPVESVVVPTGAAPYTWRPVLDHLTSATHELVPDASATSIRVEVDLPAGATRAVATLRTVDGRTETVMIPLDEEGDGAVQDTFEAGQVASVEVTVANADVRYDCWEGTAFACQGRPAGDDQVAVVEVSAA